MRKDKELTLNNIKAQEENNAKNSKVFQIAAGKNNVVEKKDTKISEVHKKVLDQL